MARINGTSDNEDIIGTAGEFNAIAGNAGDDYILGRGLGDLLLGGPGKDTVLGANGDDELYGSQDDDTVIGGSGDDTIAGDRGDNLLIGGNGDDTFVINAAILGDGYDTIADFDAGRVLRAMTYQDSLLIKNVTDNTINLAQSQSGTITVSIDEIPVATIVGSAGAVTAAQVASVLSFTGAPGLLTTNINGTAGDDTIEAAAGFDNIIAGNAGNDAIIGAALADVLLGNAGADTIRSGVGDDTLFGSEDADRLFGEAGDDALDGDLDDDWLFGGSGADTLTGGTGADIFFFRSDGLDGAADVITDYDAAAGDVIEMSGIAPAGTVLTQAGPDAELLVDGQPVASLTETLAGDVVLDFT
ncbi:Poly(beta-D-mannuronate) C5 epimerase 1 [Roseivivax jejudonensis]|uniref:Poly(Beta-D-mannuronate) C5 epimerase 1 n=1 Tax=Roseivivax jejudonensis TaxID=1529041 RepID=A0A1X6YQ34_9RHOB|nr:calcium-binding protein [Roseivivax jejudonensis]SLN27803.1 Poly(beta-D-mannuronate) C5 epimerase 1 [Roseivivax jejudonensis]